MPELGVPECGVRSAKCGVPEFGVRSLECRSAEFGVRSSELGVQRRLRNLSNLRNRTDRI